MSLLLVGLRCGLALLMAKRPLLLRQKFLVTNVFLVSVHHERIYSTTATFGVFEQLDASNGAPTAPFRSASRLQKPLLHVADMVPMANCEAGERSPNSICRLPHPFRLPAISGFESRGSEPVVLCEHD
jgi:hypothetical protein